MLANWIEQPADNRGAFARIVERAAKAGTPEKIVSSPEATSSQLPLEGLIQEGTYLVLHAKAPIAFAWGAVTAENGFGLANSRVTATGLGTADLSVPGGMYAEAVPAGGSATLTALHPTRDEKGTATAANVVAASVINVPIVIHPVAPTVTGLKPIDHSTSQAIGSIVTVLFSEPLDPASISSSTIDVQIANADGTASGTFVTGAVSLSPDGTLVSFSPARPLPPSRTLLCRFLGGVRDAGGTNYQGGVVTWSFATSNVIVFGGQVHPEKFHLEVPIDGTAKITADSGAIPLVLSGSPWSMWAEIEGPLDPVKETRSFGSDGSIAYTLGHPPTFAVTIASVVWVHVISPDGSEAEKFRLGPFVTPDHLGFVAPPGEETKFTTAEGVQVVSPAGAFDVATLVHVNMLNPATTGVTAGTGFEISAYVNVDFDGQANKTLRIKVPVTSPSARIGSLAFAGIPIDLPWGKKLQIVDLGSIIDGGNGTKLISNFEEDQPADPTDASGTLKAPTRRGLAGSLTPRTLIKTALLEFQARGAAAWFNGAGAELGAATGGISTSIMDQFGVLYNFYADAMVYLPMPRNWTGGYILPLVNGQPFLVVGKDRSTGWAIVEQNFGSISGPVGSLLSVPPVEDTDPNSAILSDAYPFSITRFKAEKAGADGKTCLSIRLELQACSLANDVVQILKATDSAGLSAYSLADETRLSLFRLVPMPMQATDVVQVAGGSFDESKLKLPAKSGAEMLLVVSPGELDPNNVTEFRFAWDKPLAKLFNPAAAVKLLDCGELPGNCGSGVSFPITLDAGGDPTKNPFIQLRILLQGELPHGHLFSLALDALQFRRIVKDASGNLVKPALGPLEFLFATRKSAQHEIGASSPGVLGDGVVVRDLVKLGNLMIVSTSSGDLVAIDVSTSRPDSAEAGAPIPFKPFARLGTSAFDEARALKSDGHNRIFFSSRYGGSWGLNVVRLEDIRNATVSNCNQTPSSVPAALSGLPCFLPVQGGVKTAVAPAGDALLASEYLTLVGALPTGIPTDMDILVEDFTEPEAELKAFYDQHKILNGPDFDSLVWNDKGFTKFSMLLDTNLDGHSVRREQSCSNEPGNDHYQRVTVDNVTTGQNWSFDVENAWPNGTNPLPGTLNVLDIRARRGDKLRVRYNLRSLGYVAIVGSGVGIFDLNRFYRLTSVSVNTRGDCGRRLGRYEGTDLTYGSCAGTLTLTSITNTTAVAALGSTPSYTGENLNVFAPVAHFGGIQVSSPSNAPGGLGAGAALCFQRAGGDPPVGQPAIPKPWM
ncbi:MAG: Ig-like domain-containing protein, partial [Thermoanaerobaculia bacterium]